MTLQAGSRVRTASDSQALLTFFNGTSVNLEPGTDLVVEQVERGGENQPTVIVVRQWLGKTWSRVTKLADPGSHYEIQTPSAIAVVRGTMFSTEVDETGATRVQTTEGLVSVSAQGEEVYVPAGQQTSVEPGASPSEPIPVSFSEGEVPLGLGQEGPSEKVTVTEPSAERAEPFESTGHDPEIEGPREQSKDGSMAQSPDNEGPPAQGQDELPLQGQDSGQGQATGTGEGQGSEQHLDYMWWVILGVMLFSVGVAVFTWRRQ